MIEAALSIAFPAISVAMLLDTYRIVRGPDLPDRVLGLDTLVYNAIALLMVTGIHFGRDSFFGDALVIAMISFVSTVALCSYLLRGEVIE
jgi:multicomponent K+:H+ antiporter subunit F